MCEEHEFCHCRRDSAFPLQHQVRCVNTTTADKTRTCFSRNLNQARVARPTAAYPTAEILVPPRSRFVSYPIIRASSLCPWGLVAYMGESRRSHKEPTYNTCFCVFTVCSTSSLRSRTFRGCCCCCSGLFVASGPLRRCDKVALLPVLLLCVTLVHKLVWGLFIAAIEGSRKTCVR